MDRVELPEDRDPEREARAEIDPADRVPRTTRGDQDPKQRDRDVQRDVDPFIHAPNADTPGENDLRAIDEIQDQGGEQKRDRSDADEPRYPTSGVRRHEPTPARF
jgi:hypothetical protein